MQPSMSLKIHYIHPPSAIHFIVLLVARANHVLVCSHPNLLQIKITIRSHPSIKFSLASKYSLHPQFPPLSSSYLLPIPHKYRTFNRGSHPRPHDAPCRPDPSERQRDKKTCLPKFIKLTDCHQRSWSFHPSRALSVYRYCPPPDAHTLPGQVYSKVGHLSFDPNKSSVL